MIYFTENETKLYLEVRRLSLQAVLVSPWKKKNKHPRGISVS